MSGALGGSGQVIAEAAGYAVRPSQTGRLNQLVIDMWGGLEAAAAREASSPRADPVSYSD
jgi:hypothetical protein